MSSESLFGETLSGGSSSGSSSLESWTHSLSRMDLMSTESANRQGASFALVDPVAGDEDPSPGHVAKGTEADMEIVEEGNEAKTASPTSPIAKGCLDLFPATFWIGRSRVMEEDLDEFDEHGLIKASLNSLCHTLG